MKTCLDRSEQGSLARVPLCESVAEAVGLRVRDEDKTAVATWAASRARALALGGSEQFQSLLSQDSEAGRAERERITARFTTGETYFFRDPGQLDLISSVLLPERIERRTGARTLRIWSAGCGGGEEAYSLAIMVDELAERLAGWNVLILGTDINSESIGKARLGIYGDWSFRGLDAVRKRRYFAPRGKRWEINPRLRAMVSFNQGDLIKDPFPEGQSLLSDFDLILCRNVFIYLDARAIEGVSSKFARALTSGGYLVTGHNELFGRRAGSLRTRMFAQSAVLRRGEEEPPFTADSAPPAPPVAGVQIRPTPQDKSAPSPPRGNQEQCDELMRTAWRMADLGLPDPEELCVKAIGLSAFDPRPYYLMAQVAQERGESARTKTLLKKVIYLDPTFIAASLELGALYAQADETVYARRTYQAARRALAGRPPDATISPYSESTARDALAYVDRLLAALSEDTLAPRKALR